MNSDEQCDKPETIVLKDELDRTLQKSESKHETKHGHARGHRINMELMKNASVVSWPEYCTYQVCTTLSSVLI